MHYLIPNSWIWPNAMPSAVRELTTLLPSTESFDPQSPVSYWLSCVSDTWASMWCTFVAFYSTAISALCVVSGAILHYFMLATFILMAAEAINLFNKLVLVFSKVENIVTKAAITAWGKCHKKTALSFIVCFSTCGFFYPPTAMAIMMSWRKSHGNMIFFSCFHVMKARFHVFSPLTANSTPPLQMM